MADMLEVDITASYLVEHRFDPQHDIHDRPEQQRYPIAVVILFHFLDFSRALFPSDLAH